MQFGIWAKEASDILIQRVARGAERREQSLMKFVDQQLACGAPVLHKYVKREPSADDVAVKADGESRLAIQKRLEDEAKNLVTI